MGRPFSLPASALCPACSTVVILPAEPIAEPLICATCGSEVPDHRRVEQPVSTVEADVARPLPVEEIPIEDQRYSRRNLFRSLGGLVAEKGIVKIDEVKSRFTDI
jgi:hypothetical protein